MQRTVLPILLADLVTNVRTRSVSRKYVDRLQRRIETLEARNEETSGPPVGSVTHRTSSMEAAVLSDAPLGYARYRLAFKASTPPMYY